MRKSTILLFLFISFNLLGQDQNEIGSLVQITQSEKNISLKIKAYTDLSQLYIFNDSTKASRIIFKMLELSKKNQNYKGISSAISQYATLMNLYNRPEKVITLINQTLIEEKYPSDSASLIYNTLGLSYFEMADYDKSANALEKAMKIAERNNQPHELLAASINYAVLYDIQGHYTKATEYYFEALRNPIINKTRKIDLLINLSSCYNEMEELDLAIKYGWSALSTLDEIGVEKDKLSEVIAKGNLAESYFKLNKLDSAEILSSSSLKVAQEISDEIGISYAKLLLGKIYNQKRQFYKANIEFEGALQASINSDNKENIAVVTGELANNLFQLEKFDQALTAARKSLYLSKSINLYKEVRDSHYLLHKIFEALNKNDSSLIHLKEFMYLEDSIFNKEKARDIANIRAGYELEKKEQEIENLEQKGSIQSLELKQSNLYLTIALIAILSLSLIGVTIYLYNRQKRYELEQKAHNVEQKLLRTQMNPHFIFNALSSIQVYIIEGDSKSASKYLTNFSKLMRQVLESSRRDFIPLSEEIEILENYLSIQNLRRDIPFTYTIQIDETINQEELQIPPMFAQPFIENAIEHGISAVTEGAHIDIQLHLDGDQLHLKITDNGVGIEDAFKSQKSDHTSLATQITRERISIFKKMLNKEIAFDISPGANNKGTAVLLKLPLSYS